MTIADMSRPAAKLLVCTLAFAANAAQGAPAGGALHAATACPASGEHHACTTAAVLPASEYPGCEIPAKRFGNLRTLRVRGRLDGGPARIYRLAVDASGQASIGPPDLAYLGQSPQHRPVIFTDEGALEVLDPDWGARASDHYLVDERRWKITARLLSATQDPIVTRLGDIGVWDKERQLCIGAVIEPGRRLRIIEGGCAARPRERTQADEALSRSEIAKRELLDTLRTFAQWYKATATGQMFIPEGPRGIPSDEPGRHWLGNVEPAETTLGRVRRLLPREVNYDMGDDDTVATQFGGAGTGIHIVRIKGSKTLIFSVSYDGDGC